MENIIAFVIWTFLFSVLYGRLTKHLSTPLNWNNHELRDLSASELAEYKLTQRFMALEEAMQLTKMRFSSQPVPDSLQKLLSVSFSHRVCHIFVGQKEGLKTWFFDWLPADGNLTAGLTVIALEVPQEGLIIPPFCLGPTSAIANWRSISQLQQVPLDYLPQGTHLCLLEYDKFSSQWFQSLPAELWDSYPAGQLLIYDGEWLAAVQPQVIPAAAKQIEPHIQQLLTFYHHFFKNNPS